MKWAIIEEDNAVLLSQLAPYNRAPTSIGLRITMLQVRVLPGANQVSEADWKANFASKKRVVVEVSSSFHPHFSGSQSGRFFGWIIWFKGPIDPNLCEQFCAIDSVSDFAAFKLREAR